MSNLPGPSDYRAFAKGIGLLLWILLVAWWLYPAIFVVTFFWYVIKALDWLISFVIEEVKYARSSRG